MPQLPDEANARLALTHPDPAVRLSSLPKGQGEVGKAPSERLLEPRTLTLCVKTQDALGGTFSGDSREVL